jgi:hypothetical protein
VLHGNNLLSPRCLLGRGHELQLDAIDSVDTIDKEDEDEYETDLHPVLNLGDDGALGDEAICSQRLPKGEQRGSCRRLSLREDLPLDGKWEWDDEEHEQCHLQHQEHEHLEQKCMSHLAAIFDERNKSSTPQSD